MFKRLRQLEISLAAKCQLLFGAAVILIIGAALFVPWWWMERLMEQLNENAAESVARQTIDAHIVANQIEPYSPPLALPAAAPATTQPITTTKNRSFQPPRLIIANADLPADRLTRFERSAIRQYQESTHRAFIGRLMDDATRYRYLRTDPSCIDCHAASLTEEAPSTQPAAGLNSSTATLLAVVSVDIPSQIQANQILLNRVFLLMAGTLAGAMAIITFWFITTRLILQPVRVLQETAEKVSQGDLNIRSDINTGDEFQVLSETFNTMLTNLKRSSDQLRAVNKSLDLKLGQLAETNVSLYESNRLKSEFLANVSHELRTPLNSILGFTELLKDYVKAADPKATRYLLNIVRSGNNLLDLINDLLDLAKIEAGKMEVRSEPLSVPDLFEALEGLLKPLCTEKKITIVPTVTPGVPILRTDTAKLQQILYNFLSNAIKFSPNGAEIRLEAQLQEDGQVKVSVIDRGPGISVEQQQLIFEKFRQIDGSVTRQHSGTGLGLAISKELAHLMGGSIGVHSVPGEGATFWVVLPQQIEASAQDVRAKLVLT